MESLRLTRFITQIDINDGGGDGNEGVIWMVFGGAVEEKERVKSEGKSGRKN
jgi:hypothetical protein